eukprot:113490-Karenia_brevis.AAC.1
MLHSFRDFTSKWTPGLKYKCVCHRFHDVLPSEAWSGDGHVAVPGSMLVGLSLQALIAASSNSRETIFPSKDRFANDLCSAVLEFWQANGLGTNCWGGDLVLCSRVRQWVDEQWPLHEKAMSVQRAVSETSINEIKGKFGDLVWHCDDHKYTQLVGYCP